MSLTEDIEALQYRLGKSSHGEVIVDEDLVERILWVLTATSEPIAWILPGDDFARDDGSLDAMAWQEGEFTRPLYAAPSEGRQP